MIVKSFEIEKLKIVNQKFFLFYGENEGLKNQTIQNLFKGKLNENIYRYDEKEILDDKNNFIESISTKSFFDNERLIIISRTTDKIINFIEEVIEKNIEDLILILNSDVLEKKSKLRSLFEKNKQTVCVPFYADNSQTLSGIVNNFFREKRIPISQELINLLVSRSRGDRQNIKNELNKREN